MIGSLGQFGNKWFKARLFEQLGSMVFQDDAGDISFGGWLSQHKALQVVTFELAQHINVFLCFYAFGRHMQLQSAALNIFR